MELSSIRTHVLEQMDWVPTQSAEFKAKVNRFVNRAYQFLYEDAPFLLQSNITIQTKKDVSSLTAVAGDRVSVHPTDPYVMTRAAGAVGASPWVFDGTWDGRWVDLVDNTGVTRRVQTREWWTTGINSDEFFSLVFPWPGADTDMTYRVYTPVYHLPGDVVAIKNAQLYHGANYQLKVSTQGEMEQGRLVDYQGRTSGLPRVVFPGIPFSLDAPTRAPSVALGQPTWDGPDNAGDFDFCYTYGWGRRDAWELSHLGLVEPVWESAPSPVSARISTTNGASSIVISGIPNIDKQLNFGASFAARDGRSGMFVRIWARRYTSVTNGGLLTQAIESPQVFMLLSEIAGDAEQYVYIGDVFHDYNRRLKKVHNHFGVRFFPQADDRYEVDMRVQMRPVELTNDQDAPRIPEDAIDLLIQRCLVVMYEYDGKPELSQLALSRYKEMLGMVTKRYSGINYDKSTKRLARISSGITGLRARSVTYTEPT
jgi:hypothetical protein